MRIKNLLITTILVLIASASFSQKLSKDSCTCIPNDKLRIAAYKIEKGARDSVKIILLENKIDTLESVNKNLDNRIALKDNVIKMYTSLESTFAQLEGNYINDIAKANQQYEAERNISKNLEKKLKGARRKTVFVGIAGIAATLVFKFIVK